MKIRVIIAVILCLETGPSWAEVGRVSDLPLPRFVSFKSKKTNVRAGPSDHHPVKWVYHKKGYPIQIVAEFEHWRKIKDIDAEEGWVHESMLSGARYVVVVNNKPSSIFAKSNKEPTKELLLLRKPDSKAQPVSRLEMGVVCKLKQCNANWCEIYCDSSKGWILHENAWGIASLDINAKFK